jgi:oxygen-independent coproporphyrinogen-3 oxidase
VRWREPEQYMQQALAGAAVSNEQVVTAADLPFEFMLNALRLREGFDSRLFVERTGLGWHTVAAAVEQGVRRGWLRHEGTVLQPTARGFDFLSDVQQLFLP